jgi:hypothetical protein
VSRKILSSVALSLFLSVCFFQICYLDFEKIRLTQLYDASGPNVEFSVDKLSGAEFVLLEFRNGSNAEISIEVNTASQPMQTLRLKEKKSLFYLPLQGLVQLKSSSSDWTLKRAELRNLYGSGKGIFSYIVIPADSQNYERPSVFASVVMFFVLFPLTLLFSVRGAQASSLHKGPQASGLPADWKSAIPYAGKMPALPFVMFAVFILVLLFFGTALLLPYFSPYRVLLAAKTFLLILTLLYLQPLRKTYVMAQAKAESIAPEKGRALFQTGLVALAVFTFFLLQMMYSLREFKGNYSGFLVLSPKFVLNNPLFNEKENLKRQLIIRKGTGYDAQFMYVMAFDPLLSAFSEKPRIYRKVVDYPPYRYGRIGFSLLAKAFSLNQPEYFPKTMILLLLLSHCVGAFFLARIAAFYGRSPYWALLYLTIPAFTVALRLGLPESLAAALMIAALFFYLREKIFVSCCCLALAILVRETTGLLAICIIVYEVFQRRFKQAGMFGLPLIIYFGWRAFVGWRLFRTYQWEAIFYDSGGVSLPFSGLIALYNALSKEEYVPEFATAAAIFPLFLIALFLFSLVLIWKRRDALSFALLGYSLIAVSLDYRMVLTPILNAERVTYEAFVLFLIAGLATKTGRILQIAFVTFFFLLFLYDWSTLTYSSIFRAGFLWQTLTS